MYILYIHATMCMHGYTYVCIYISYIYVNYAYVLKFNNLCNFTNANVVLLQTEPTKLINLNYVCLF